MNQMITFSNLNEAQKQLLRQFEMEHEDQAILKITHKAFDGEEVAQIVILGLEALTALIGLIIELKKLHDMQNKEEPDRTENSERPACAEVELRFTDKNGNKVELKLEDVTKEGLEVFFS